MIEKMYYSKPWLLGLSTVFRKILASRYDEYGESSNKKETLLEFSDYQFQTGLSERDFSKASLKRAK